MTPSTPPSSPRCDTAGEDFSIVGVGASAGGLQALRQLLTCLPADTGMAFVIVQHLDPNHPSLLANVLAGETSMAVREAADGTRVQPNRVYVIPPAADLRVKQGVLVLVARQQPGRLHLPIDAFFESLAEDQPGRAIGVVLSGSGSDGTEGLRAIKNAGGITFAQEPASAQFPSMPESALAAGVVDFHLSPLEIAQELVRLSKHPYLIQAAARERTAGFSAAEEGNLEDLLAALRAQSQIDFTGYKQPTVLRRIARRMALRHVATMREYADALRKDPVESRQLAEDILIQVTSFFRDPAAFAALKERVFPELLKHKEEGAPIRIWVAGCASGEEAYSLAICLDEFLERQARKVPIKIFGTDLSSQAIATARLGVYPESKLAGVSPERLARYFDRTEGRYCVSKRIRDCCVFVQHHLTRDPPFAKLDLISCRNVLIYFDAELQQRVFPMLHYCLNRPGFLFLGISEAISGFGNLFTPLDKSLRIYEKTGENQRFAYPLGLGHASEATLFSHTPAERRQPAREVERQADHYLLNRFAPAGVIVNERLEVVQFRGQTGTFLQAPPGQPQLNVVRMARPGLVGPLQAALEQAKTQGGTVRKEGLSLQVDTFSRLVNLEVVPLPNLRQSGERYFLAWFEVVAPDTAALGEPVPATPGTALRPAALPERDNAGLNMEIAATRSYLEALLAEHQTTTDDLAVTNEELVASNEELQSTNEELQGTQEELQSTNEELNTVNDELRNRNQALDLVASDLENVLESVKLPLIIVDGELRIRRFTPMAQLVSNLIAGDVGRSIEEVKLKVKVDDLTQKIQDTLTSLTPKEWDIQGSDDRWFRMQIRPYRGSDKRLDGVLLTFFDVDVLKRSLQAAESARDYARSIVEAVQTALVVLDSRLCVVSANRAFCELVQAPVHQTEGVDIFSLAGGAWQVPAVRDALERSMATRSPFSDLEIQMKFSGNGHKDLSLSGRSILGEDGHQMILLAIQDITQDRLHEAERAQLLASAQRAGAAADRANHAKDLFLALLSHELRTPLNAILLSTHVLSSVLMENPIVQRMSTTVERAVAAQTRLIDDLLDTARITSGKLLLDLQAVDLGTVVRTAVDVARSSAELKGVELTVTVSDSLGPIYGDPARLQQVVGNLLNNAIKFTPRGGTIAVCVDKAHGQARIEVTDTGMGISPELLPRLFERFVQADSAMTRTYGGLGLGLAIVRHLVEVHGGKVEAESPGEGRGATFRVLLPFAAHASLSGTSAPRESVRSIAGVRVLLIDDDESTREACVAALAIQGANALGAGSAAEGLAALETFHPQVILCDIAMPMHDGYYFLHQLRSLDRERGGQTPIAALTALASAEDRLRAQEAGFQLHLVKPINSAGLTAAVATLVDWTQPIDGPVQPAQ